jgi:hypothetical protein
MSRTEFAQPKAIGEDVEQLVIDAVQGLRAAVDPEDWYDAHAETAIGPRSAPSVIWSSICLLESGHRVEIKACKRRVSNGTDDRPGRWMFQADQHARLLADNAVYLLAVYTEPSEKVLEDMVICPASILDECLAGRWYDVDRHEGSVAQLAWPHVLGSLEVTGDAE